jgi:hypothetical protein
VIRRAGTLAVLLGALLTVVLGGFWVVVAWSGISAGDVVWASLVGLTGSAAVATGVCCLFVAAPDLLRGTLSRRAERWAWIATAAFVVLSFASVWLLYLGVVGPIATLGAVRLARGPRWRPDHRWTNR